MGQINTKQVTTFIAPPTGYLGWGFDIQGNPCRINADGSKTIIPTESEEGGVTTNIIANIGIGLLEDLSTEGLNQGDVYVTTDTLEVYTRLDAVSWGVTLLIKSQFITDTSDTNSFTLFQYDGTVINQLNNKSQSGKTTLLLSGEQTIPLPKAYIDENYEVLPMALDVNGVISFPTFVSQNKSEFVLTLYFDSYITFITHKN